MRELKQQRKQYGNLLFKLGWAYWSSYFRLCISPTRLIAPPPSPQIFSLDCVHTCMIAGNLAVILPMLFTMSCGRFWYAHRSIYKSSCKPHDVVPMANLCQKSNPDENLWKKEERGTRFCTHDNKLRNELLYERKISWPEATIFPLIQFSRSYSFSTESLNNIFPRGKVLRHYRSDKLFVGIQRVHNQLLLPYLITKLANNKDFHDMSLAKPILLE